MKPFYSVNFNARMCNMKISVNEIPLLSMDVEGQCSTRYPFNNLLLETGFASIRYEVRPMKGELQLRKDAYLSCEVELFDSDSGYEPISKMAFFETPQQNSNDPIIILPYIIHEDAFHVEIPYSLTGWKHSVKLNPFRNNLGNMVFEKYGDIISMMQNHNFSQYENAFRERENNMAVCFYLSENEKQNRMKEIEHDIVNCTEIVPLTQLDRLEFAADNRLVRLIKDDGESSLRLVNDKTGEETYIELWLHMKQGSNELTII